MLKKFAVVNARRKEKCRISKINKKTNVIKSRQNVVILRKRYIFNTLSLAYAFYIKLVSFSYVDLK